MNTLFARKAQQAQRFLENGTRIPVTLVVADGNVIMGEKTMDRDNYTAVKLGFGKTRKTAKSLFGEAKKANLNYIPRVMAEVRVEASEGAELGSALRVEDIFKIGDIVDVTGTSKGKGFAGGVKRYNFRGGPKTHGQSDRHRAPGSIGSGTTPGRVYKGKRMAGNMGHDTVTVKNLTVIEISPEAKTLLLQGLVPGILNGIIKITKVGEIKEKSFVPLFQIKEPIESSAVEESNQEVEVEAIAEKVEEVKEEVTLDQAGAEEPEVVKEEELVIEAPKGDEATEEVKVKDLNEVKEEQNG